MDRKTIKIIDLTKDADIMFLNFMDRKTIKIIDLTKKESRVVKLTNEMKALEYECNKAEKKCTFRSNLKLF